MKSRVLEMLNKTDGYISGSYIASELNVTRASVWKYVKALKEEGYEIDSVRSKGYKLRHYERTFNKYELEILVRELGLDLNVYHFSTIDSTNTYAKQLDDYAALIVADEQTCGRGRLGRTWSSKRGDGLYFSLMIRPQLPPYVVGMLTQLSAIALRQAVSEKALIKWPNDIFISDKKIAGILTELITEIDMVEKVIIGVGLNLKQVNEFKEIATSIFEEDITFDVFDFFRRFLSVFFELLNTFEKTRDLAFIKEKLEKHSYFMNKEVYIVGSTKNYVFKGITDNGNAILEDNVGELEEVFFGEISLKRR